MPRAYGSLPGGLIRRNRGRLHGGSPSTLRSLFRILPRLYAFWSSFFLRSFRVVYDRYMRQADRSTLRPTLSNPFGDAPSPSPVSPSEVFVKQDLIAPVRVGSEILPRRPLNCAPPGSRRGGRGRRAGCWSACEIFPERQHLARARGNLDRVLLAQVVVETSAALRSAGRSAVTTGCRASSNCRRTARWSIRRARSRTRNSRPATHTVYGCSA